MGYGILSLIPPLLAIVLCIKTKRVYISLYIGILSASLIVVGGNPISGIIKSLEFLISVVQDPWNATYFLMLFLMGSGTAFVYKLGGASAVVEKLKKKIKTKRGAMLIPWVLGLSIFFNEYADSIITGPPSKPITGKFKVSREKLSFIMDSTASPASTFGPVSDWIGYQLSIIKTSLATIAIGGTSVFILFLKSIPWNVYCWLSLILPLLIIVLGKGFGPMAKAELRAKKTGRLIAEDASPLAPIEDDLGKPKKSKKSIWSFIIPIAALVLVTLISMWWTGKGPGAVGIIDILANAEIAKSLLFGSFSMTLSGFLLGYLPKKFSLKESSDVLIKGWKIMIPACGIMLMAWGIGAAVESLGTAEFLIGATGDIFTPPLLFIIVFTISCFISFSTGTSWGTMALVTPIALPLANSAGGIGLIPPMIGIIFSGAIFGDHTSPISDTTIMSSIFSGSDVIDHVRTQLPYSFLCLFASALAFIVGGFIVNSFVVFSVAIFFFLIFVWYFIYKNGVRTS